MTSNLSSGLFVGEVRHRRFTPIYHEFRYPLFMVCLDLDEIETLASKVKGFSLRRFGAACFYRQDYMEGRTDTKRAVLDKIFRLTGTKVEGKVYALCHLRYLGLYFSPVNFYYVFDMLGNWTYMLAEVSNTPWLERHYYAIPATSACQHDKGFHVSPFNSMAQVYQWQLRPLTRRAFVHLEAHEADKVFDATLFLKKREFTSKNLLGLLLKTPMMTVKVIFLIYWQALKLWWKGAPFYPHPNRSKE